MAELEPITRKEQYLAKAAGQDVTTPEPVTREEMYLDAIAKNGGGGGGSGGSNILVELKISCNYIEARGLYVFVIIGNDEDEPITGETIIQYVKDGKIPYVMLPIFDENGQPDDTIKLPSIFCGAYHYSDDWEFSFGGLPFVAATLDSSLSHVAD